MSWLLRRFPLHTHGLACSLVFACSVGLYGRISGVKSVVSPVAALTGCVTFVAFFFLLRIADDLDDGDDPSLARGLMRAAAVVILGTSALNASSAPRLVLALVSSIAIFLPLTCKRLGMRHRGALAVVYECVPALFQVFPYAVWKSSGGPALPWYEVTAVGVMFWSAYEFWKFTRKIGAGAVMQPYFLRPSGLRWSALTILAGALLAHAGITAAVDWAHGFSAFLLALPALFAILLVTTWPRGWDGVHTWNGPSRRLVWRGLVYPAALIAGTAAALWI